MNQKTRHKEFMSYYEPIHEGFVRYCSVRSFGIFDTEDLVQESVAIAFSRFDQIKNKQALLAYLMKTASNLVASQLRRKKFKSDQDVDSMHELTAQVDDPALAFDIAELYKALNKLPEKMREAVVLFEITGYSMKEIAEIQKSSVGAVKVRIHRGREKLREIMVDKKESQLQAILQVVATIAVI